MLSKTLSIMFVDLQGYTLLTSQKTREEHHLFVTEIHSFIERHARNKRGRLVKSMGDGFLITFESPTDAINCGMAIQEEICKRNGNVLDESHLLKLRVGISTGEVNVDERNDVYGEAVNIAARIEKFCDPNEVFISESTYLAMNRAEINALDLGPLKFKNVSENVRVFKILKEKRGLADRSRGLYVPMTWKSGGVIVAISLAVLFGIMFFWKKYEKASPPTLPIANPLPSLFLEKCQFNIQRYCQDEVLRGGVVVRCLMQHYNELDPECLSALPKDEKTGGVNSPLLPTLATNFPQKPFEDNKNQIKGFVSFCDEDIRNFCQGVRAGGRRIMRCLKEHLHEVSEKCRNSLSREIR